MNMCWLDSYRSLSIPRPLALAIHIRNTSESFQFACAYLSGAHLRSKATTQQMKGSRSCIIINMKSAWVHVVYMNATKLWPLFVQGVTLNMFGCDPYFVWVWPLICTVWPLIFTLWPLFVLVWPLKCPLMQLLVVTLKAKCGAIIQSNHWKVAP